MAGLLCLKWNNHSLAFLNLINDLHAKELYCDATIACHGKYYPVHRMVLSTCSEYFQDIFKLTHCKHPFIIVNDIKPAELEALLNYMYKGDVNVLQEMLPNLIKAAEALKVKGLAVPDELPPEKESANSRKRSSNSSSSSSQSKRSRVSEKTISYEKTDASEVSNEVDNEHSIPRDLPQNNNENITHILPREQEIKVEPSAADDSGGAGPSFGQLDAPPFVEAAPLFVKSEPYDDHDDATYDSHQDKDHKGELAHYPQPLHWSSDAAGNEASNQTPTSELPSQLTSEAGPASSQPFVKRVNTMPTSSLNHLQDEVSSPSDSMPPAVQKMYRCSLCSYQCRQNFNLKRHIKHIHTGEKPYSCILCSYRCVSQDSLKNHLRIHTGEKPFQCNICFRRFADRSNHSKHMQFIHSAVNFKVRPRKR